MTAIVLASVAFAVALACAVVMGFAIQRGATCTVLAVAEVVRNRRFGRLASMIEASLWVLGGLLAARTLGLLHAVPAGYAIEVATVLGGVLLGIGAYVNGACVFGAIARLGSGEWSYIATPVGFFIGCAVFGRLRLPPPQPLAYGSPVLGATGWIAAAFTALLLARLMLRLRVRGSTLADAGNAAVSTAKASRVWSPHTATITIGIAFVVLLLLVGAWTYTDALAELARGMAENVGARMVLFAALLAGAILGGWSAGRLRSTRVTATQLLRCFAGGALMAFGTLLVPGSNDGLILLAMPLLWPYAWVAFATMCASIALALLLERARQSERSSPAGT